MHHPKVIDGTALMERGGRERERERENIREEPNSRSLISLPSPCGFVFLSGGDDDDDDDDSVEVADEVIEEWESMSNPSDAIDA